MSSSDRSRHRIERRRAPTLRSWGDKTRHKGEKLASEAVVDCGWGRLIFAHTFDDNRRLADTLLAEEAGRRDIALYLRDPHVVLAMEPQEFFLDPSHTYRLWFFNYRPSRERPKGFRIRRLRSREDAEGIYRLLVSRRMVPPDPDFVWETRRSRVLSYFVAEDVETRQVIGTVMGVDHVEAFDDPENGSSMWCLAVDPQATQPGIGRALVGYVADHYAARGRDFMDLSVMHDNEAVIRLYEKMGFERIPAFCLKRKNAINEPLFVGSTEDHRLNPYARIIVDEARRRGIAVEVLDGEEGYFALTLGGRSIICRESLSELTNAIAMSRCSNKRVTRKLLEKAGIRVPDQEEADGGEGDEAFLERYGRVVAKPAEGEQGRGVSVDIREADELRSAVEEARRLHPRVILEEYREGDDLRVIVIGFRVVAAAIRRPAQVTGTGSHDIETLIRKQSRRREAATGGESRIPLDDETRRCVRRQGYSLEDVPEAGTVIRVRETANLHTGGTLHDVTDELSDVLRDVSERSARVLDIPVVGMDLIVDSASGEDYVVIEANERPGLANHEPQPTAERFVDLLFPQTVPSDDATD